LQADLATALDTTDFLKSAEDDDALNMLTSPFRADPSNTFVPETTRYSDGTWRVFYSALESATARAEKAYWCGVHLQSQPPSLHRSTSER
jgi:hypothetical protein